MVARRQEIESDPLLDADAKIDLIAQWRSMADEARPLMDSAPPLNIAPALVVTGSRVWVAALLVLSLGLLWAVGGMHPGALQWPGSVDHAARANGPAVNDADHAHPGDGAKLEDRLAGLESRLKANPDDLQGWVLLARTQASLAQYSEAASSLRQALRLSPGHPDLLADLADLLAMAQGRVLTGEPAQYIAQALKSDPRHEKALALAATAAEQAGHTEQASMYWNLLSQVQQSRLKGQSPAAEQASASAQPASTLNIQVIVNLPSESFRQASPSAVLFVVAKMQASPGMPLAALRIPASQLKPGQNRFALTEGNLIQPDALASFEKTGSNPVVFVQARLAQQGTPAPAEGDLQSDWQQTPLVNAQLQLELTKR